MGGEVRSEQEGLDRNTVLWRDRKHFMWFPFSFTKYEVRNGRLYSQRGFFKTVYDEVLLYRILDVSLTQTFRQKIFGTGTITVCCKVNMGGDVYLVNVKHPRQVSDLLSDLVEKARDEKRVVGKEFYSGMDDASAHAMEFEDIDDVDS